MGETPEQIGRYVVRRRLGGGGMGVVFLAHDPVIDRLVAVKVLGTALDDEDMRARFAQEVRSTGSLVHRNIVTVYDAGEHDGKPFIAMEYVEGRAVSEVIQKSEPMSLDARLSLIEDLCAGLAYAHQRGIIHRDIKPANLMVGTDGVLRILDFGIARMMDASRSNFTTVGTPGYMSPEQILADRIDHRSDLFGTGLVMYELLSYKKAFPGATLPRIIHAVLNDEPKPLHETLPELDPGLIAIVDRALKKDADERYPDAMTMATEIRAARLRLLGGAQVAGPMQIAALPTVVLDGQPPIPFATLPPTIGPGVVRPITGVPSTGVRNTAVPATGVPATGVPATGVPATGVPATGVPATGVSAAGVPGVPATGVSATGVPGVPATGVPTATGAPAAAGLPTGAATGLPTGAAAGGRNWMATAAIAASALIIIGAGGWLATKRAAAPAAAPATAAAGAAAEAVTESNPELRWVSIPAGEFLMGCVPGDTCAEDEKHRHKVRISHPFELTATEVTWGQYERYATQHHIAMPATPEYAVKKDFPVVNVDWDEAAAYCKAHGGRLPTEAEWEYAARGGQNGWMRAWGSGTPLLNGKPAANLGDESYRRATGMRDTELTAMPNDPPIWMGYDDGFGHAAPVASFAPNGFGLHDVSGNVQEWVADWESDTQDDYKVKGHEIDPVGPAKGERRGVRGDAFWFRPKWSRLSARQFVEPDRRESDLGFRCAR